MKHRFNHEFNPFIFLKRFLDIFEIFLEKITIKKSWIIKATLICTFLSLFNSFPSLESLDVQNGTKKEFINQIDDLQKYWNSNITTNLNYRITQVFFAKIMGGNYKISFLIQFISGIFSFYFLLKIIFRITGDKINSLLFTAAFATTVPGISSFISLFGSFDGLALFFIIIAMFVKNNFIIPLLIIVGSLTDERAFLAAGFIVIFNFIDDPVKLSNYKKILKKEILSPIIGMLIYLVIRLFLTIEYDLAMEDGQKLISIEKWKLLDQVNMIPFGIWTSLEGFLIVIILCLYPFWKINKLATTIFLINIFSIIILAFSVHDISRGLLYLFPSTIIGIKVLSMHTNKKQLRKLILTVFFICLFSFNYSAGGKKTIWWHYPLPIQIVRLIIN
tara:strand:- start:2691 stop:3857 length:1167 start_codon:yes stop_codon:yes gene_type:complete